MRGTSSFAYLRWSEFDDSKGYAAAFWYLNIQGRRKWVEKERKNKMNKKCQREGERAIRKRVHS